MPVSPCLSQDFQAHALSVEISGGKSIGDQNINFNDDIIIIKVGRQRSGFKDQRASSTFLLEINNPQVMGRSVIREKGIALMRAPLEREKSGQNLGLYISIKLMAIHAYVSFLGLP